MLTAYVNGKYVYANREEPATLRTLSQEKKLVCPDCGSFLFFKQYRDKSSHFYHERYQCSSPFSEAETLEHEKGKKEIKDWVSSLYQADQVVLEQHIKKTNQRADIFVLDEKIAFEFQCSPIKGERWSERVSLYKTDHISSFWILGMSMLKRDKGDQTNSYKLNSLEHAILSEYGFLLYYDVYTHSFFYLHPFSSTTETMHGLGFFLKPQELFYSSDHGLKSKLDYFIQNQMKRSSHYREHSGEAKKTSVFIKEVKKQTKEEQESSRILATKKQLDYIKFLFQKNNQKTPYKLQSLTKEEASSLIEELKNA